MIYLSVLMLLFIKFQLETMLYRADTASTVVFETLRNKVKQVPYTSITINYFSFYAKDIIICINEMYK